MVNILLVRRPNVVSTDHPRLSTVDLAKTFQLSPRTVDRILEKFHATLTPQYVLSTYCMSLRPFHSCLRLLFSIHSVQYTQYTLSVH